MALTSEKQEKFLNDSKGIEYYQDSDAYCTEGYHKICLTNFLVATDGVKNCLEKNECFWFTDIIFSYLAKLKEQEFLCCFLILDKKEGADFYITDGNDNLLIHQRISCTDLKVNLKFFVERGEKFFVALLPSEH